MNDTPLIAAWRKIAANQDGPPDITVSRPELRRLIAEMDDHRDRVDDEAWNDLFDGVGDEWDGDEAISSIAVRYVQHLRAEVVRLGGCTRPWCWEADGEQCDHGYNAAETTVRDGAAMISAERHDVTNDIHQIIANANAGDPRMALTDDDLAVLARVRSVNAEPHDDKGVFWSVAPDAFPTEEWYAQPLLDYLLGGEG